MNEVVRAAGGIVHRIARGGEVQFAVVHRTRHRDWVFPKGKLEAGEGFRAAAVREVREESACDGEIESVAGVVAYDLADGTPKMVVFYAMHCARARDLQANDEVDALEWLTAGDAERRLTYADERALLRIPLVCTGTLGR